MHPNHSIRHCFKLTDFRADLLNQNYKSSYDCRTDDELSAQAVKYQAVQLSEHDLEEMLPPSHNESMR